MECLCAMVRFKEGLAVGFYTQPTEDHALIYYVTVLV